MIRVLAMYPQTEGARFDLDYYVNTHIPMCQKFAEGLGMVFAVDRGIGTVMPGAPAPFVAMAVVTAPSLEALQQYLGENGAAIMGDIPNYTDIQPVFQISEVVA